MTPRPFWALVGALTLGVAHLAPAQAPAARHGFWGAFGLGYGANGLTCSGGCSFNSDTKGGGLTAALKLGGTPSPRVRLGGEVNVWTKDHGDVTESVGNVSVAVYFYPTARSGFFVKARAGLRVPRLEIPLPGPDGERGFPLSHRPHDDQARGVGRPRGDRQLGLGRHHDADRLAVGSDQSRR